MRRISITILLLASALTGPAQPSRPSILSVCDALANRVALINTEVAVRGIITRTRETFNIGGMRCENFDGNVDGVQWKRALFLTHGGTLFEGSQGVSTDKASYDALLNTLNENPNKAVWATIYGRFVAREHYRAGKGGGDGRMLGNGFGPGNLLIGQIVIRSVGDLEVRERSSP